MKIRLDNEYKITSVSAEGNEVQGNNYSNSISVFMPDDFDFNSHWAFANFKLSNGKEYTGLVMTKSTKKNELDTDENCYYYVMPSFLTKERGKTTLTISVQDTNVFYQNSTSMVRNSNYYTFNVDYAIYSDGTEVVDTDIITVNEIKALIAEGDNKKLDKDFSTNSYPLFTWEELDDNDDYVPVDKVSNGVVIVGKVKVGDLYNKVNEISPVDGNIELDSGDIPYKEDKSVEDELDSINEELSDVVHHEKGEETNEPALYVTHADSSDVAEKDKNGNVIHTYYMPKNSVNTYCELKKIYSGDLGSELISVSTVPSESHVVLIQDTNSGMTSIGTYNSLTGAYEFNYETMYNTDGVISISKFKYKLKRVENYFNFYIGTLEYMSISGAVNDMPEITAYNSNAHRNGNIYLLKVRRD